MQRRRAVEQYGVIGNNLFENIPNFGAFAFNQFLWRSLPSGHILFFEFHDDEGFEKLQRHHLRHAALMEL